MPDTAITMQKHLGVMEPESGEKPFYHLDTLKTWKTITPGIKIPKSTALFPRIEIKKIKAEMAEKIPDESGPKPEIRAEISMETFSQVDLRVATVVHAEAIPRAKKLLKLEVDIGEKRTIVAGIAENYMPEDLVGKQVIIVANLKPAKLMGVLSKGMLIAAVDDNGCTVATLDKEVKPGTRLS